MNLAQDMAIVKEDIVIKIVEQNNLNKINGFLKDEKIMDYYFELKNSDIFKKFYKKEFGYGGSLRFCHDVLLYCFVRSKKFSNIYDVGTNCGSSAITMALAIKNNGNVGGKVTTCDIVDYAQIKEKSKRYGLNNITFYQIDSKELTKKIHEKIDFVFLDGDKNNDPELKYLIPSVVLKNNGAIAMHDISIPEYKLGELQKKYEKQYKNIEFLNLYEPAPGVGFIYRKNKC